MPDLKSVNVVVRSGNELPDTIIVSRDRNATPNWESRLTLVSFGGRAGLLAPADELVGFLDGNRLQHAVRLVRQHGISPVKGGVSFSTALVTTAPLMLDGGGPVDIDLDTYSYMVSVGRLSREFQDMIKELYLSVFDPSVLTPLTSSINNA